MRSRAWWCLPALCLLGGVLMLAIDHGRSGLAGTMLVVIGIVTALDLLQERKR